MSTNTNQGDAQAKRSASRPRMASRPTTPLRSASRTSLRESQGHGDSGSRHSQFPLDALEPAFAELADSMADLEANFMHLQLMHESLARFSEDFASFLYGLNMNAFCVDFPEAPIPESFKRALPQESDAAQYSYVDRAHPEMDHEATFLTTDTSFVEHPPQSSARMTPKPVTPAPSRIKAPSDRGMTGTSTRTTRGTGNASRGSGLARAKGRHAR